MVKTVICEQLPDVPELGVAYRLLPREHEPGFYEERTDRNIGWNSRTEQEMLRNKTVGIAGCGGMGGMLAQILFRAGVGKIRIADPEVFDVSNLGRQFAATIGTVGQSKAVATARATREILDDGELSVYPQGICEDAADSFLEGCDVVCDEIEFWAVGARILLHQRARKTGVAIFNCNTVGRGGRLFWFDPHAGVTIEQMLGMGYEEATRLQNRIQNDEATCDEIRRVAHAVIDALVPEIPEYCPDDPEHSTVKAAWRRILYERKAMIDSTNPPHSTGFLADWVKLFLLRNSGVKRKMATLVPAPGYFYFDAQFVESRPVYRTRVEKSVIPDV